MPFVDANAFVAELNKQFDLARKDDQYRPVFAVRSGPVYDKVVTTNAFRWNEKPDGWATYCFINAAGDVFKAAGWNKPAKGVRANLYCLDEKFIAERIVAHGYASTGWLYR